MLASYFAITVLNLLSRHPELHALGTALLTLTLIFLLQLHHSAPDSARAPARRKAATLAAQCLLTYLPLLWFGITWGAMAGFLAGSLVLLLPARWGWFLYGVVSLSLVTPGLIAHRPVVDIFYMCQTTALTGLVVYAVSRLSVLIGEVHQARAELAHMAVASERLRFSRDLHDLLGFSLSSITLKNELIHRLIAVQPDQAKAEVEEVLSISREALADVRRVASGYRQMSLATELASARSILVAAAVEPRIDVDGSVRELDPQIGTVLAAVLREGVTNLLRHSKASRCCITAGVRDGVAFLSIVNDGLTPGYSNTSPDSGSGLGNLEQRLRSVNGTLTVSRSDGPGPDFRLVAEIRLHDRKPLGRPSAAARRKRKPTVRDGPDTDLSSNVHSIQ